MYKTVTFLITVFFVSSYTLVSQENIKVTDDIYLIRLSGNAYIHTTYINSQSFGRFASNGLIYIKNGKYLMIDTPCNDSITNILCNYIDTAFNVNLDMLVATHWHTDCMGGIHEVHKRNGISYSLDLTKEFATKHKLELPQKTFHDSLWIDFQGTPVLLFYPGAGHTKDNIVCWLPEEKILFGGCLIKTLGARSMGNLSDAVPGEWGNSVTNLKERFPDADFVIPGHGDYGNNELLKHTLDLCNKLL